MIAVLALGPLKLNQTEILEGHQVLTPPNPFIRYGRFVHINIFSILDVLQIQTDR